MVRRTREQIVSDLEAQGLSFRTFSIVHDSPHALSDWDWNQRDLPHIPFVHGGFRLVHAAAEDGLAAGIYVQRVLGLRVPMTVTFHHLAGSSCARVYQAALGPLVLVIGADLTANRTGVRVSTVYSVGSLPATRLLLPLAERLLRRNYARIHDEDEPLRRRRHALRAWGYRFTADSEGGSYGRSLDLGRANVIAPPAEVRRERVSIAGPDRQILIGRDDHVGLQILVDRRRGCVSIYPRMCPHEGASLDGCAEAGGALRCPWHGRRITPLASFDLHARGPEVRETPHHRLELAADVLRVAPR
jgi:hypothetical protein